MSDRHLTFLVHGRCACGWECACPEGSTWPKCPLCGDQVLPPMSQTDAGERQGYVRLNEPEALREAYEHGYEYASEEARTQGVGA